MEQEYKFDTIEQAIADLKAGKMVLVTDDADRENEGDLIAERRARDHGGHQLHGHLRQRPDLYALRRQNSGPAAIRPHGSQQHR